jgi:hypothetical protein
MTTALVDAERHVEDVQDLLVEAVSVAGAEDPLEHLHPTQ